MEPSLDEDDMMDDNASEYDDLARDIDMESPASRHVSIRTTPFKIHAFCTKHDLTILVGFFRWTWTMVLFTSSESPR